MADTAWNLPGGDEKIEEEEDREQNDVVGEERVTNSSSAPTFMAELNLVMMVAFLTLSADEISRLEEDPEKVLAGEEHNVREVVSKLKKKRRRQTDDFKTADRQVRSQMTKIVDSRHGRKM